MTDDHRPLRGPRLIEQDLAVDPGAAPLVSDLPPPLMAQVMARRASPLLRGAFWAFSALFTFALSVAAYDFVTGLMARNAILGWVAAGLTGAAVGFALVAGLREWAAFLRLGRLEGIRAAATAARGSGDMAAARAAVARVAALYAARPELAEARARLAARGAEVMDADALIDQAEQVLILPLDARARAEVEAAARQVATVTALVPMALADVAAALIANIRMIRRIAEIYGGRSGGIASVGLLRRVFAHLLATGAVALTDDLIGSVAGGGVLSKLSRRFGEGVVNGALTARVGVAAMELCRPLPFGIAARPGVSMLVSRALAGLFGRGGAEAEADGRAER